MPSETVIRGHKKHKATIICNLGQNWKKFKLSTFSIKLQQLLNHFNLIPVFSSYFEVKALNVSYFGFQHQVTTEPGTSISFCCFWSSVSRSWRVLTSIAFRALLIVIREKTLLCPPTSLLSLSSLYLPVSKHNYLVQTECVFNWSIVDFQCHVTFMCITKLLSYTCTHSFLASSLM